MNFCQQVPHRISPESYLREIFLLSWLNGIWMRSFDQQSENWRFFYSCRETHFPRRGIDLPNYNNKIFLVYCNHLEIFSVIVSTKILIKFNYV